MRIAVLSLTRDRLAYTKHCFETLNKRAGCRFGHFVLDQGSTDGTLQWLSEVYRPTALVVSPENIGIHKGWNRLLSEAEDHGEYDAFVTFDNDCEVLERGTLRRVCRVAVENRAVLSPTVLGLKNPPVPTSFVTMSNEPVGLFPTPGGIFRCLPAAFTHQFSFDTRMPIWGGDEQHVGRQALLRGFRIGYLMDWHVNHYETTVGQEATYPEYFERKYAEMV